MGIDATFAAFIALIIFLMILIFMQLPQKMLRNLDKRAARIAADLEHSRLLREEAQNLLLEFQKKSKEAEREAEDIIESAKRCAEDIIKDSEEKTQAFILWQTSLVEQKIAQAELEAIEEIKSLIVDLSMKKARKFLH